MSDLEVSLMKEEDIDGAIATIQQAFAEDPYNKWIYDERPKVRPQITRTPFIFLTQLVYPVSNPPEI
jgi:hypothetical protein